LSGLPGASLILWSSYLWLPHRFKCSFVRISRICSSAEPCLGFHCGSYMFTHLFFLCFFPLSLFIIYYKVMCLEWDAVSTNLVSLFSDNTKGLFACRLSWTHSVNESPPPRISRNVAHLLGEWVQLMHWASSALQNYFGYSVCISSFKWEIIEVLKSNLVW
jgi:hypothetical protein